jgi:hypothetical protein
VGGAKWSRNVKKKEKKQKQKQRSAKEAQRGN